MNDQRSTGNLSESQVNELIAIRKMNEEIEKAATIRLKRVSKVVGLSIMGFGCLVGLLLALIAQYTNNPIHILVVIFVLAIIVSGGLLLDPERCERLAGKALAALPGGSE